MEYDTYRRMADIQNRHWWYEGRRRILKAVITRLNLPDHPEILEAGSGTGANLVMLSDFGQVQGFEPDDFARENARKVAGLETRAGALPDNVPYDGPYDLTCAFDVIEHVEDDCGALAALCALTKPGGYAVFTVPAFPRLWSYHDEINHHFRRYIRRDFRAKLEDAGYEVLHISYYNMLLFPVAVLVRGLRKLTGRHATTDDNLPRWPFVNRVLTAIFAAERHILCRHGVLPFGLSLIAVCRRPAGAV